MKNIFVAGPTASGKSLLAATLAHELSGVVINVDSCQIYEGLPLLTAQPEETLKQLAPHFLYSYLPLKEDSNVAGWLEDVKACLESPPQDQPKIFVGGTGLYFMALYKGLQTKHVTSSIRQKVQEMAKAGKCAEMYAELKENLSVLSFHANDTQRILRAYELYLSQKEEGGKEKNATEYTRALCPNPFVFYLNPERDLLRHRIKKRIERMMGQGAVDEVRPLMLDQMGRTAQKIIGVMELKAFLEGKETLESAQEKMFFRTCQYAKRQRTWFTRQLPCDQLISEVVNETNVQAIIKKALRRT